MDTELEKLYLEWEQEEIEYQNYLNSQIHESKKVQQTLQELKDMEEFNLWFLGLYLHILMFCMKFIVLYVNDNESKKRKIRYKIEKTNYSVLELD
jgi:hypothetical protein